MNTDEIIEKSQKLSGEIFDKMNTLENCSNAIAEIADLEIGAVDKEGQIVTFSKVLNAEQMEDIKADVLDMIERNRDQAARWRENLTNASVTEATEEEKPKRTTRKKTTTTRKKAVKKEEEEKPVVEIDEKQLAEMFVRDAKTVKDIAEELGTDKEAVHAKIMEYGFKKPTGMDAKEEADWRKRVMARY